MRKITNTEAQPPMAKLAVAMMNGGKGIELQEKAGQRELVEASQLPRRCNTPRNSDAKEIFAKFGITVIGESEGDDIFYDVQLPEGWKVQATEHSMWSKLLDDKGRKRADIFYKAAYYDRNAHISFNTRYSYGLHQYPSKEEIQALPELAEADTYGTARLLPHYSWVKDLDGTMLFQSVIKTFEETYDKDRHREWWDSYSEFTSTLEGHAKVWIDVHYPDHNSIFAYWD